MLEVSKCGWLSGMSFELGGAWQHFEMKSTRKYLKAEVFDISKMSKNTIHCFVNSLHRVHYINDPNLINAYDMVRLLKRGCGYLHKTALIIVDKQSYTVDIQ